MAGFGGHRAGGSVPGQNLLQDVAGGDRPQRRGMDRGILLSPVDDLHIRLVRFAAAADRHIQLLPALRPGQHRVGGVDRDPLSAVHRHRVPQLHMLQHIRRRQQDP